MKRMLPVQFRRREGFTAIEVVAVATIIALLALVLIPILRTRVEEAKIVAAQDDMRSIEIAETLAFADTGFMFRLQDLRRPKPNDPNAAAEQGVTPAYAWNGPLFTTQVETVKNSWQGVQISMHRFETIENLYNSSYGFLFSIWNGASYTGTGPIIIGADAPTSGDLYDDDWLNDLYPIDPWGSPYLFFGRGIRPDNGVTGLPAEESNFQTAIVYSLGPDGLPGQAGSNVSDYYRESGVIGDPDSDDLYREF